VPAPSRSGRYGDGFLAARGFTRKRPLRTIVDVVTAIASADLSSLLSRREGEVMHRAAQGMTNAQIAAELAVSTHAVKFHLASIYRKLGVANRTEATARYVTALTGANRPGVS